jgi:hypothetical protein
MRERVPRFQLLFRYPDGDQIQLRDKSNGEPTVDGQLLADGAVFRRAGASWRAGREDLDGLTRFVCIPVPEPTESQP